MIYTHNLIINIKPHYVNTGHKNKNVAEEKVVILLMENQNSEKKKITHPLNKKIALIYNKIGILVSPIILNQYYVEITNKQENVNLVIIVIMLTGRMNLENLTLNNKISNK